ncbi:tRNA (cmo5U34)-methyltransferase [Aquimarina sp. MAR_2010_214]|uniref:class I SAM-dependent methyltransferase n=1 Tax=Aquimarina sp. MAR_2010_214 TaxID=1250026 RepID=UPI000C7036EA|nr:class I SAM-dependent methyltransferase [Aquimarina sp. MAR_2010_214]PKV49234.1 tRNA (cmo5U34)-methyltransferase [Aquimarina sp. MAR_2010_214]
MNNSVNIFEGDRAINYDEFVQCWIPNYDYFISTLPQMLKSVCEKEILVAGCGTGNEILAFAQAKEDWSITGVDPSPEMVSIAKKKLHHYKNIKLIKGEVTQLPTNELFGAATLLLVLHFIKDDGSKLQLLKEIAQRLRPGSPFVLMSIFGNKTELKKNLEILKQLLSPFLNKEDIDERIDRITNTLYHDTEERLIKLLIDTGFEKPVRFFQTSIYGAWITKKV